MSFLPEDFEVPPGFETEQFRVRPLTIHDVVLDYDAVMTNRDYLWSLFSECWSWPPEDLSIEQDMIDLAWHQKEGQLGRSFVYAVMTLEEDRMLGCVYLDPPSREDYDVELLYWVRRDHVDSGLDASVIGSVREWLADEWPFERIAMPGREIPWSDWLTLEDAT